MGPQNLKKSTKTQFFMPNFQKQMLQEMLSQKFLQAAKYKWCQIISYCGHSVDIRCSTVLLSIDKDNNTQNNAS